MSAPQQAIPFINPFSRNRSASTAGNKVFIEPEAYKYFNHLTGYDQMIVAKGIDNLRSVKYPMDGGMNKFRPMFWRVKKDPGVIGNFLIHYEVFSDRVTVRSIELNDKVLYEKDFAYQERKAMYKVDRVSDVKLHKQFIPTKANLDKLRNSWGDAQVTTSVNTEYAAVNGMLNEFQKAVWLMGVHVDYAYSAESPKEYTLFHNPSQDTLPDFYESVRDQLGFTTPNAKYLASVMQQIQVKGKPVKWVVHSQGGIIFKEAIRHHLNNGGGSLNKNSVIFHSGGNRKTVTDKLLAQVGIKKNSPDNNNPFDMVPNIAGMNDLSCASIKRCISFAPRVTKNKYETDSPHTLPFMTLDFYRRMLIHAGDYQRATQVKEHMKKTGIA